jgi:hypothetical protein
VLHIGANSKRRVVRRLTAAAAMSYDFWVLVPYGTTTSIDLVNLFGSIYFWKIEEKI